MTRIIVFLYRQLLQAYPRSFRAQFGAEMQAVYSALLAEARRQGMMAVIVLACRELAHAPGAILRAHWWEILATAQRTGRSPWGVLFLPPVDPRLIERDGRHSRPQAILEILPLLLISAYLIVLTYGEIATADPGLQRQVAYLRPVALLVALPASLLGVGRGLPRWAYPWLGFLAGYWALVVYDRHMLWFYAATLLACLLLALAAAVVHARAQPLPPWLQWLGHSLQADWTRLSFAILGALPFLVLVAFDDGYLNNRTLWLGAAMLFLVLGAGFYSRSRHRRAQMAVLLSFASLSLVCALLNHAYVRGGLQASLASWANSRDDSGWLLQLWALIMALLIVPSYMGPLLEKFMRTAAGK